MPYSKGKTELLVNYPKLHYRPNGETANGESEGKEHKGIFPAGGFHHLIYSMGQYIVTGKAFVRDSHKRCLGKTVL